MLKIKKALAINCWDVLYNGRIIERFDKKHQAEKALMEFKILMGVEDEAL